MKFYRFFCLLLVLALFLSACQSSGQPAPAGDPTQTPAAAQPEPAEPSAAPTPTLGALFADKPTETPAMPAASPVEYESPAHAMNARLGRGINLGNALEAPKEGAWGVTLQEEYFALVKEKGFRTIRVPIRWSAHAAETAPYTIDPNFFKRIDWVIEQARANDLNVMINMHHYDEIFKDPKGHQERFLALWQQIAERYKDQPDSLLFEPLNEPHGDKLNARVWNELFRETLAVIRATNPERIVVVGPVQWNSVDSLQDLSLPADDNRLIVTFHYYQPFNFTHQGAEWQEGADKWLGTKWENTDKERVTIGFDLTKAVRWAQKNRRPIFLGEFGAYSKADMTSRALWTASVARQAEENGFSWAYWEFCSGFGIYDARQKVFYNDLVTALVPTE